MIISLMSSVDERLIYVVLGILTIGLVYLLLLAGPFGWFFAIFVVLGVLKLAAWSGVFEGSADMTEKTNCPNCGARNDADRQVCPYCETELSTTE